MARLDPVETFTSHHITADDYLLHGLGIICLFSSSNPIARAILLFLLSFDHLRAVVLWFCGFVVLWCCGSVVLWFSGSVVLWFSGSVVLWWFEESKVTRERRARGSKLPELQFAPGLHATSRAVACHPQIVIVRHHSCRSPATSYGRFRAPAWLVRRLRRPLEAGAVGRHVLGSPSHLDTD